MSQIDWSKAPEDAQYARKHIDGLDWYKRENGIWLYLSPSGVWDKAYATSEADCEKRPQWSGDGLPPVGVRCEAAIPHTSGPDHERRVIWIEGSVIAYYEIKGKTYAWFAEDDGFYPPNVLEFRPIRTEDQIAAEEREKAIDRIMGDLSLSPECRYIARRVVDAGYRKP